MNQKQKYEKTDFLGVKLIIFCDYINVGISRQCFKYSSKALKKTIGAVKKYINLQHSKSNKKFLNVD